MTRQQRSRPNPRSGNPAATPAPTRRSAGGDAGLAPGLAPWLVAAALLAVVVHLNAFGNAFVFDDLHIIRDNPNIRSLDRIPELFRTSYWGVWGNKGLYRPLVLATYALNHAVGGLATQGYTAVNLALHAGVTVLVVLLARALGAGVLVAGTAGLLFAVHPVHTEAVTGFVGRAETLAAFLVLLALWLHRRGGADARHRSAWRAATAGAFLLALLAKENAVTFLGVVVAMDWLVPGDAARSAARGAPGAAASDGRGTGIRARWRSDYPTYAAVLVLYLVVRYAVLGTLTPAGAISPQNNPMVPRGEPTVLGHVYGATFAEARLTAIAVLAEYARLLVWPVRLSCDYSYDQIPLAVSLVDPRVLAGIAILAGSIVAFVRLRRRAPLAAFALAFFWITFSVSSNLWLVIGTICAERLLYLPSAGFALLLATGWARLAGEHDDRPARRSDRTRSDRERPERWRRVVLAALAFVVLLGAGRTWARNRDWRDALTLWESAVRAAPRSAKAHAELGRALGDEADRLRAEGAADAAQSLVERAAEHLERALEIYPEYARAANTLTGVALERGDLERALELCELSVALDPNDARALSNWALALMHDGDRLTREAERLTGGGQADQAAALHAAARARYEEAVERADRAIAVAPDHANAYYNRAVLFRYKVRDADHAAADFEQVLRLVPDHPQADAMRREIARLRGER